MNLKNLIRLFILVFSVTVFSQKLDQGLYAKIKTDKGDILLKLEFEKTPITVANFVSLSEGTNNYVDDQYKGKPFFDGLKFHRVIKNFMIQGGDPLGTGAGNPGYKFKDEFDSTLKHDKPGVLSMANSGPATNGSQFFITHKATPWLNGKHTVFGNVVKGQEVINDIKKGDKIISVKIIRKGKNAKKFDASKIFDSLMKKQQEKERLKRESEKKKITEILEREKKAEVFDSGLKIFILEQGIEPKPEKGDKVIIHYTGYFRNGKKFDSSVDRNTPFTTPIGVGRLIKGWDEGVLKLNVGTKAILYVPAELAYGKRGAGNVIPPNSDLIFEIELLDVVK
jgi:cyclophilin family peptidyl-prolyl cis-trans isomerase